MAISGFGRSKGGDSLSGVSTGSTTSSSGMGGLTAFIDQGSQFEGKLSFKDTVRIDGCFHGEISSENTLIVGETGEIEATIRSTVVVISGSVTGDIFAGKQILLHKTARVQGQLHTPSIAIEEGAIFNGTLSMKHPSVAVAGASGNLKAVPAGGGDPNKAKLGGK